jgi:hypothetical protein
MPATVLYNEGWMLRLLLDAGERGLLPGYVEPGKTWFSEAQLRTPFGRKLGRRSESNTRPDGVVGDFHPILATRSGLDLREDAATFVVFEAKMFASLGSKTRNAPGYDQVARSVACMAYALQRAGRAPDQLNQVGFFLVAPRERIVRGVFNLPMTKRSIRARINERISHFGDQARPALDDWRDNWASPLIDCLVEGENLRCVQWEELIALVTQHDAAEGPVLDSFYQRCLEANRPAAGNPRVTGLPQRGMEYTIRRSNPPGRKVRVCKVGRSTSRVCYSDRSGDCFLVANVDLVGVPPAEQTPPPPDPVAGETFRWDRPDETHVLIRVIRPGPCNSRVVQQGQEGRSFLVPNHRLHPTV